MGRVRASFTVSNYADLIASENGWLAPDTVRHLVVNGIIDPGVMRMILPESVAQHLDLPSAGLRLVRNAHVKLCNRGDVFNASIEAGRCDVVVGAMVLSSLDLIVDPETQRLVPRDPDRIIVEIG